MWEYVLVCKKHNIKSQITHNYPYYCCHKKQKQTKKILLFSFNQIIFVLFYVISLFKVLELPISLYLFASHFCLEWGTLYFYLFTLNSLLKL